MVRAIAFLFFTAASCPGAGTEPPALRVTFHRGAVLECGPSARGRAVHVRRPTTLTKVEERAFEIEGCPENADCRAPLRTRVEVSGGAFPDFREVLQNGEMAFELEVEPGSPCRWSLSLLDDDGAGLSIENGRVP